MPVAKSEKRVGDPGARADALLGRWRAPPPAISRRSCPGHRRFEADVAAAVVAAPEVTEGLGQRAWTGCGWVSRPWRRGPRSWPGSGWGPGAWPHRWGSSAAPITTGLYGAKGAGGKRQVAVPPFLESRLLLLLGTSGHLLAATATSTT